MPIHQERKINVLQQTERNVPWLREERKVNVLQQKERNVPWLREERKVNVLQQKERNVPWLREEKQRKQELMSKEQIIMSVNKETVCKFITEQKREI